MPVIDQNAEGCYNQLDPKVGLGWKGFNREEAKLDWVGA